MTHAVSDAGDLGDREIANSRIIHHPPERVFAAWSDPERLARWWGPKGFTNTFELFDFQPGGAWTFVMHGPDGADYPNRCVFEEIARPERIVLWHVEPMHSFRLIVTLEERGGSTHLRWRMVFDDPEECARVRPYVTEANEQNLDRLEAELATL